MRKLLIGLVLLALSNLALADGINIPPVPIQASWTPAVTGASVAGTGQTYSIQIGSYEQIGRQITARFTVVLTSVGTASGNVQLSLPIQAANVSNDFGGCFIFGYAIASATALNYGITGNIAPNSTVIILFTNTSLGQSQLTVANIGGSGTLQGVCNYRAS